jgi:hypothetical protein
LRQVRSLLFDKEPVAGLSGLVGLTAPGPDDGVALVVDAIVLGAKGDGKTQLITHAVRTLDARGPAGLSADEELQNEKLLALVLNAKRPQPEANPDRKVRHYVTRVQPKNLLGGQGVTGQLAFLVRAGLATRGLAWVALSLPLVLAALRALRGDFDAVGVVGVVLAALAGAAWVLGQARAAFRGGGAVEVVFWDVAGEDVYSDRGAAAYHAFLEALAARRRQRPGGWALAPVLVCNPLGLGQNANDSPYARLRMILPSFAAIGGAPEVLVVVNRWDLGEAVVAAEARADECVAVVPVQREVAAAAASGGDAARERLPVVRRDVVLRHCLDGEPESMGATRFRLVRYEAGLDTEVSVSAWAGYGALPDDARARFADPGAAPIAALVEYRYAEGPGVLDGDAALGFYAWLGRVLTTAASGPSVSAPAPTSAAAGPDSSGTAKMYGPLIASVADEAEGKRGGFQSGS